MTEKEKRIFHAHCRLAQANIDQDELISAVDADDHLGFCVACGSEHFECEPDARRYACESCGEHAVYGAEELLIMLD